MKINWHLLMVRLGFSKPRISDIWDRMMKGRK